MSVKISYSTIVNEKSAAADLKNQLGNEDYKCVLFFASSAYDAAEISAAMKNNFRQAEVFGCSTSGEIVSGKVLKNSIVAMAFSKEYVDDIKISVVDDISGKCDVKTSFREIENYYDSPGTDFDYQKYFGFILIDGLSKAEEKVMDKIGDLTNCYIIGGSAGDDLKFEKTYVYENGNVHENAAIIAFVKANRDFDIIKTQSFDIIDKKLKATNVNVKDREVIEFNEMAANKAYAQALGIDVEKAADYFMSNPVGLVIDDEIYVRSPQQIKDNKMVFYCNILDNMEVSILRAKDMIGDTKKSIDKMKAKIGSISAIVNFHCILRTLDLENTNKTASYGEIFRDIPTIGFSTYGEQYLGHINQTSTMLVFK